MRRPALTVVVVYPDLLGTYGDGGNGLVLAQRARWRGVDAELVQAPSDQPLPEGDIYCLGGGEDGPQAQAARSLAEDGRLTAAVEGGATVLAVCAGFQIVGQTFPAADGTTLPGLGLLEVSTVKGPGPRAVGEVLAQPVGSLGSAPGEGAELPLLTGFENHAGATTLGPSVRPLGRVVAGVGNQKGTATEGAHRGRVVGTYLHGPVLARNPALADALLSWAVASSALAPLDDRREEALRRERIHAARLRGTWRERVRAWRGR